LTDQKLMQLELFQELNINLDLCHAQGSQSSCLIQYLTLNSSLCSSVSVRCPLYQKLPEYYISWRLFKACK